MGSVPAEHLYVRLYMLCLYLCVYWGIRDHIFRGQTAECSLKATVYQVNSAGLLWFNRHFLLFLQDHSGFPGHLSHLLYTLYHLCRFSCLHMFFSTLLVQLCHKSLHAPLPFVNTQIYAQLCFILLKCYKILMYFQCLGWFDVLRTRFKPNINQILVCSCSRDASGY